MSIKPLALVVSLYMLFSPYLIYAEKITYKVYLSIGFLNVQVGESTLSESKVELEDVSAVMSRMIMTTDKRADRVFFLRDTITSYSTLSGMPLLYTKSINEGGKCNVEIAEFDNSYNTYSVVLKSYSKGILIGSSTAFSDDKIYDMLSMLRYTRNMSSKGVSPGHSLQIPMVNGLQVVEQHIVYEGMESVKAANGKKYDCLALSVRDYKYGEERETLRVLVTSDSLHIPVQLDLKLGMGKIRVLLTSYNK
ncbi:MAG TPA: DUF3108 domain-containing protein [Bacteroidaceae bacterium]|nr:DUF3108 domain-containing protein [Bacteroidaceae bacterium]